MIDYICSIKLKTKIMETSMIKNSRTNKVTFYRNGKQVFDFVISGNIVMFDNGDYFLI